MFTTSGRLHMICIMIFIMIAMYIVYIYREIKTFETEINTIKASIENIKDDHIKFLTSQSLINQSSSQVNINKIHPVNNVPKIEEIKTDNTASTPMQHEVLDENSDDDENMSITSNEIKDILTNIQSIEEEEYKSPTDEALENKPLDEEKQLTPHVEEYIEKTLEDTNTAIGFEKFEKVQNEINESIASNVKEEVTKNNIIKKDMTVEQLNGFKYDDLRSYIRKNGGSAKGNKQELIQKIANGDFA
jgi:hypothetical protein